MKTIAVVHGTVTAERASEEAVFYGCLALKYHRADMARKAN